MSTRHTTLPINRTGRDFVVGDVHGYFEILEKAIAELGIGPDDRLISLGDLVDRGPHCERAIAWMRGSNEGPRAGFDAVLRGNHEQLMLEGLREGPPGTGRGENACGGQWPLWMMNGGGWWTRSEERKEPWDKWITALDALPYAITVQTPQGAVGLVHAAPAGDDWERFVHELEDDGEAGDVVRMRATWSRMRHGRVQREIGERGDEPIGEVSGVRAVITGHTPVSEPKWHTNVLDIDTGVHVDARGYGSLTIARIDTDPIEHWSMRR